MSNDKNIQDNTSEMPIIESNDNIIDEGDIKEVPAEEKASKPSTVNVLDDDNYDHISSTFEERVNNQEPSSDSPKEEYDMTEEDVLDIAEFFFEALDTGICFGLSVYSGDSAQSQFAIEEKRKKRLVKMLAVIIVKHKLFLRIEFVFIIGLVFAYGSSVRKAHQLRKERKKKIVIPNKEKQKETVKAPTSKSDKKSTAKSDFVVVKEDKKENNEAFTDANLLPSEEPKRRPGRPSKYAKK